LRPDSLGIERRNARDGKFTFVGNGNRIRLGIAKIVKTMHTFVDYFVIVSGLSMKHFRISE